MKNTSDKGQFKKMKLPTLRKIHLRPTQIACAVIVLLLVIFFGRVALWEHSYLERMVGSERASATTEESIPEAVDETEPTDTEVAEYIVAPDKPRYLTIPSIGIKARVVEVNIKSNGELATPYSIYDVGWYNASELPGTNGVAVIDGHGGYATNSIFEHLPNVKVGDEIEIEMGDGRLFTYQVSDTVTKNLGADADEYMTTAFTTPDSAKSSLTLITCTGDYWIKSRTYSQRLFVRATLKQ